MGGISRFRPLKNVKRYRKNSPVHLFESTVPPPNHMEDPFQNGYPGYCLDTAKGPFRVFWGLLGVYRGKGGVSHSKPAYTVKPLKKGYFIEKTP